MKRLMGVIGILFSCLTAGADWLYTDQWPWVWSTTQQSWEYSLTSRIPLWSLEDDAVNWLGWEGDLRELVRGFARYVDLKDDNLILSYDLSGLSGMWVYFGRELDSETIYADYIIALHSSANIAQFFVSEKADSPTLSFSLVLEFTGPLGGRYTLQGIFPDRTTSLINGFYSSSGEFIAFGGS